MTKPKNNPTLKIVKDADASVESRLKRIRDAEDPGPLVKALPPHDFLIAWRAADDEQRADLMRLADTEQVSLLVDLSCWPSDVPDLEELESLIKPLALSGLGGAVRAVDSMQPELKTLLLKRNARIHLLENRNDEVPAKETSELLSCPDGMYYIEFPEPENVGDVERAIWAALLSRPFETYQPELECIRHDLPSELIEAALRWRSGRLADWGFVSRGDAVGLLSPRSAAEVRSLAERMKVSLHPLSSGVSLPKLYRDSYSGNEFLDKVIGAVEASGYDGLNRLANVGAELTLMTGTFLTAISADIQDIDAVARGAGWARDLLALGIFETAEGDVDRAAEQFVAVAPGFFLQVGLGLTYPLARRAKKLLADRRVAAGGRPAAVFDAPHRTALWCLTEEIPLRWPQLERGGDLAWQYFEPPPSDLAAFAARDEIDYSDKFLAEAEELPALLFGALKCDAPPPAETQASMLVLTALANAASGKELKAAPIEYADAVSFKERVKDLSPNELVDHAMAALASVAGVEAGGASSPDEEPDPRRRLLLRLVLIGRARLVESEPEHALLIELT